MNQTETAARRTLDALGTSRRAPLPVLRVITLRVPIQLNGSLVRLARQMSTSKAKLSVNRLCVEALQTLVAVHEELELDTQGE